MTEAAEIALNISIWIPDAKPQTFTEALKIVRRVAPEIGVQMTDNVASELMRRVGPQSTGNDKWDRFHNPLAR